MAHQLSLKTVAVSNGYVTPEARADFFKHIDATSIQLKGFTEGIYRELCAAELQPILDTLAYLVKETGVWLEVSARLIPRMNDSLREVQAMVDWIEKNLGREVATPTTRAPATCSTRTTRWSDAWFATACTTGCR